MSIIEYCVPGISAVPNERQVSLRVYDVQGRFVKELASSKHGAGRHSVLWDGTDFTGEPVPTGMYFCTLATTQVCQTRRVSVVR